MKKSDNENKTEKRIEEFMDSFLKSVDLMTTH